MRPDSIRGPGRALRWVVPAAMVALVLLAHGPPSPRGLDAPTRIFSAERAHDVLKRLAADVGAHPVGSAANAVVRGRLMAELRELGLDPVLQPTWSCAGGTCASLANIDVAMPAPENATGPAVLLQAHYDSVPAGPGIADDLAGTASLIEIARALLTEPAGRPVRLRFTDGEEAGLLGARSALDTGYDTVINLEARGTSGASLLFQTGPKNRWIIDAYADADTMYRASSVFQAVYSLMPNDTDLSVDIARKKNGANFAFIAGAQRYHTPRDDLAHLDLGSVQHQGQSALGLVRALRKTAAEAEEGQATYFDVLGMTIVRWSQSTNLLWLILTLVLLAFVWVAVLIRRLGRAPHLALALIAPPLALAVALGLGLLAQWLLAAVTGGATAWWGANAGAGLTYALCALSGVAFVHVGLSDRVAGWPVFLSVWTWSALLGVLAVATVPGFSYLFIVPALVAVAGGAVACAMLVERPPWIVASIVAALCWLPLVGDILDALGAYSPVIIVTPIAFAALAFWPAWGVARPGSGWRWVAGSVGALAATIVATAFVPAYTYDTPLGLNVVTVSHAGDNTASLWVQQRTVSIDGETGPLPSGLDDRVEPVTAGTPWVIGAGAGFRATTDAQEVAKAPRLERVGATDRFVLRSQRGAHVLGICAPGLASVKIVGGPAFRGRKQRDCRLHRFLGARDGQVELEITGLSAGAVIHVMDELRGLSLGGRSLIAGLGPDVVPFHEGHRWISTAAYRFGASPVQ